MNNASNIDNDLVDQNADSTRAGEASATVQHLNSFLRGEISAVESYRMAVDKVTSNQNIPSENLGLLYEIQEEHGRAAQAIRDRIQELGGEASDSSGVWGAWAKFVQGTADVFGDQTALKSLKEGEEHGLKDYAAGIEKIDATTGELVQNQLIPAQERHISLLDQLIGIGVNM